MNSNIRTFSSHPVSEEHQVSVHSNKWFQAKSLLFALYVLLFIILTFFVVLLFIPSQEGNPAGIVYFFGRFHPLIIHFPIVLIVLVLAFELMSRFTFLKIASPIITILLLVGVASSVVSIGAGFLLYYTGDYAGDQMLWHKWAGIGVGLGLVLLALLNLRYQQTKNKKLETGYLFALGGTNLLLVLASHLGGSLTHGADYLTEYLPNWFSKEEEMVMKPVEAMILYEDVVVPFLDAKCMSCHNENKTKGDLLLTNYQGILAGGKSEMPALTPSDPENSGLFHRVTLPKEEKKHMPPKGKAGLSDDEIYLLKWWISAGASPTETVQELKPDSVTQKILDGYTTTLSSMYRARSNRQQSIEEMLQIGKRLESELNIVIQPDLEYGSDLLTVSMAFPPTTFGDNEIAQLAPLFPYISKISLVGSNVTDDGLYYIGKMTALQELNVQQTEIKGPGLVYLSQLNDLSILNISKTQVDDAGLLNILKLPGLKTIYLNQVQVSPSLLEAFQKNNAELKIELDRGSYF